MPKTYFDGIEDDTQFPYPIEDEKALAKDLMLDSESATSLVFAGNAGYTPRKMPTSRDIYRHWGITLVKLNKFDSLFEVEDGIADGEDGICWGCGYCGRGSLERAHILPRMLGGSDDVANLHMLCAVCHKISEDLWGKEYWDWFMLGMWAQQKHPATLRYYASRLEKMGVCTAADFLAHYADDEWIVQNDVLAKLETAVADSISVTSR